MPSPHMSLVLLCCGYGMRKLSPLLFHRLPPATAYPPPAPGCLPQTCNPNAGVKSPAGDVVCSSISNVLFLGANAPMPSVDINL